MDDLGSSDRRLAHLSVVLCGREDSETLLAKPSSWSVPLGRQRVPSEIERYLSVDQIPELRPGLVLLERTPATDYRVSRYLQRLS